MLRREGYDGPLTMISADDSPPATGRTCPRTTCRHGAGRLDSAAVAGVLRASSGSSWCSDARVSSLDVGSARCSSRTAATHAYGALLIATGADPVRLDDSGRDDSQVHYLRTFADSRAIIAQRRLGASASSSIGASFIGLEVAASLRARDIDVHVVAPEAQPLERVMGAEVGRFVRQLHEATRRGVPSRRDRRARRRTHGAR